MRWRNKSMVEEDEVVVEKDGGSERGVWGGEGEEVRGE